MIGHFKEIKYIDINPYTMEPFRTDSLDERIKRLRSFFFEDAKADSNDPPIKPTYDDGRKTSNQDENAESVRRATKNQSTNALRDTTARNPRPHPYHSKHSPMNTTADGSWKSANLDEKVETMRRTIGERSVINSIPRSYSFGAKQSPVTVVNDNKWKKPLQEGRTQVFRPITERPVPHEAIKRNSSSDKAGFGSPQVRVADDSVLKKPKIGEKTKTNEYPVGRQPVAATVPSELVSKNSISNKIEPKKPVTETTEDSNQKKETETSGYTVGKRRAALLSKAKAQYNEQLLKLFQRRISKANKRLARIRDPTFRKKDEAIFKRIWREEEEEIKRLLEECVVNVVAALELEITEEKLIVEEGAENEKPSVRTPDASPLIDVVTIDDEPRMQVNPAPETSVEVPLIQPPLMFSQSFPQSMSMAIPYNYSYGPEQVFAYPAWYYDARQIYASNYQIYASNYQMDGSYAVNDYPVDEDCPTNNNQVDGNQSVNNNQTDNGCSSSNCQTSDKYSSGDNQVDSSHSTNGN